MNAWIYHLSRHTGVYYTTQRWIPVTAISKITTAFSREHTPSASTNRRKLVIIGSVALLRDFVANASSLSRLIRTVPSIYSFNSLNMTRVIILLWKYLIKSLFVPTKILAIYTFVDKKNCHTLSHEEINLICNRRFPISISMFLSKFCKKFYLVKANLYPFVTKT